MAKNGVVYKGVFFEDSIGNDLSRESTSICQFLYFLFIDDITKQSNILFIPTKVGTLNTVFLL